MKAVPKNTHYKIYATALDDNQDSLFWIFAIAKNSKDALKILEKKAPNYNIDKNDLETPIEINKDRIFIIDSAFCLLTAKDDIKSFLEGEEEVEEATVEKIEVNQEIPSVGSDSTIDGDETIEDIADNKKTRAIVIVPKDEDKTVEKTDPTEWV